MIPALIIQTLPHTGTRRIVDALKRPSPSWNATYTVCPPDKAYNGENVWVTHAHGMFGPNTFFEEKFFRVPRFVPLRDPVNILRSHVQTYYTSPRRPNKDPERVAEDLAGHLKVGWTWINRLLTFSQQKSFGKPEHYRAGFCPIENSKLFAKALKNKLISVGLESPSLGISEANYLNANTYGRKYKKHDPVTLKLACPEVLWDAALEWPKQFKDVVNLLDKHYPHWSNPLEIGLHTGTDA